MPVLYTIGHSTRPITEFIDLLKEHGIQALADIRTIPRSRHNPQFEQDALRAALEAEGIAYHHLKALGGLRPGTGGTLNLGWRNASFRNFADYMQTPAFEEGIGELLALADTRRTAIMCAEAVPWRCHRSLVADALLARGVEVMDILGPRHAAPHKLTPFARLDGSRVTYPGEEDDERGNPAHP